MLQFLLEFQNTDRRQLDWYGVGINSRTCTGLRCKNLLLPGCPGSPCRTHFPVDCVEKEKPAAPAAAEPAGPGPSSPAPLKPPRSDDEASEVSSSDSSSSDSDSSSTSNESEKAEDDREFEDTYKCNAQVRVDAEYWGGWKVNYRKQQPDKSH